MPLEDLLQTLLGGLGNLGGTVLGNLQSIPGNVLGNLGGGGQPDITSLIAGGGTTPAGFSSELANVGADNAMVPSRGQLQKAIYLQMLMRSPLMRGQRMPTGAGIANIILPLLAARSMAPLYQSQMVGKGVGDVYKRNRAAADIEAAQGKKDWYNIQRQIAEGKLTQAQGDAAYLAAHPEDALQAQRIRLGLDPSANAQAQGGHAQQRLDQQTQQNRDMLELKRQGLQIQRQRGELSDKQFDLQNKKLDLQIEMLVHPEKYAGKMKEMTIEDPDNPGKTIRVWASPGREPEKIGGVVPSARAGKGPPLPDNPDVTDDQFKTAIKMGTEYRKQTLGAKSILGLNRLAQSVDPRKPQQVNELVDQVASMMVTVNPLAAKARLPKTYVDMILDAQTSKDKVVSTINKMFFTGGLISPKGVAGLKEVAGRITREVAEQQKERQEFFRAQINALDRRSHVRKSLADVVFGVQEPDFTGTVIDTPGTLKEMKDKGMTQPGSIAPTGNPDLDAELRERKLLGGQ